MLKPVLLAQVTQTLLQNKSHKIISFQGAHYIEYLEEFRLCCVVFHSPH